MLSTAFGVTAVERIETWLELKLDWENKDKGETESQRVVYGWGLANLKQEDRNQASDCLSVVTGSTQRARTKQDQDIVKSGLTKRSNVPKSEGAKPCRSSAARAFGARNVFARPVLTAEFKAEPFKSGAKLYKVKLVAR